jgi:hypothetical protein
MLTRERRRLEALLAGQARPAQDRRDSWVEPIAGAAAGWTLAWLAGTSRGGRRGEREPQRFARGVADEAARFALGRPARIPVNKSCDECGAKSPHAG